MALAQGVATQPTEVSSELMHMYYKRLFPHKAMYRWLSYGASGRDVFSHREISFTLSGNVYIRYLSFDSQSEWEAALFDRNPSKIDIGPVMAAKPKANRSLKNIPVEKELVFDIDMTDYDNVRTCCSGADVCPKCWKFMTVACRILDVALREDFGFEHILWVFSGRRGIHCWICDENARTLNDKCRDALAEYLQILHSTGGEDQIFRVLINDRMHHSVKRAYRIIEPMFSEICLNDQNIFGTDAGVTKLLKLISDEKVRTDLDGQLRKFAGDSVAVWLTLTKYFLNYRSQSGSNRKLNNIVEEIQLAYLYPRLDINVTKKMNHLLKAPFCVHPSTGKICVPFNPNSAAKFDPLKVPTINKLLDEICAFDTKNADGTPIDEEKARIKDYKKTSLFKGMFVFEEFLRKLEGSLNAQRLKNCKDSNIMDF